MQALAGRIFSGTEQRAASPPPSTDPNVLVFNVPLDTRPFCTATQEQKKSYITQIIVCALGDNAAKINLYKVRLA